jgi:hypothetical protein
MSCDIGTGSLVINGSSATCAGALLPLGVQAISVNGTTVAYSISVTNAQITLLLTNLAISGAAPVTVRASNVTVALSGATRLAAGDSHAAIECAGGSNLTFLAAGVGSLAASSGAYAPAIGSLSGGFCGSLRFTGGSYALSAGLGAAVIGSGYADGADSGVGEIAIDGGAFVLTGDETESAAIGAGSSDTAVSRVGAVSVSDGSVNATACTGIGASLGQSAGASLVSRIAISGGLFDIATFNGAGIGSGIGQRGGNSTVGEIFVTGGRFVIAASGGAGIGAGFSQGVVGAHQSRVGPVYIRAGTFTINATSGAGVGSGCGSNGGISIVESVVIDGGDFTCQAAPGLDDSEGATGIGAGVGMTGGISRVDSVAVNGGKFQLRPSRGAGIGGGFARAGTSAVGRVVIEAGQCDIIADAGAAIGAGYAEMGGESAATSISISGGEHTLRGGVGAALGTGSTDTAGRSTVGVISLTGEASLHLTAGQNGAALGPGSENSPIGTVFLDGLQLVSYGGSGPAIGSRSDNPGRIANLTIQSGFVELYGDTSIGFVTAVFLGGGHAFPPQPAIIELCTESGLSAIVGSSVHILPANLHLGAQGFPVMIDSSNQVTASQVPNLSFTGSYSSASQRENFGTLPVLHLKSLLNETMFLLEVRSMKTGWTHSSIVMFPQVGWFAAVPEVGDYEVYVNSLQYCHAGQSTFHVGSGDAFFADSLEECKDDAEVALIVGLVFAGIAGLAGIGAAIFFWKTGACRKRGAKDERTVALLKEEHASYDEPVLL